MDDYSFTWKTFSKHLNQTFQDLLEDKSFANVTLVCDDQRQIRAHKFVLSACSPVFKSVLSNTGESNPLIILRGIHYEDMEAILQFMYQGEASVKKERMKDFMKAADELDLKIISQKYRKEKETAKIADTRKSPKQIRNEDEDKEDTDEALIKETGNVTEETAADQNLTKEINEETTDTSTTENLAETEDPTLVSVRNDTVSSKTPKTGLSVKDLMELAFGKSSCNKNSSEASEDEFGTLNEEDVKKETAENYSKIIIEGESGSSLGLGEPLEVTMDDDDKSSGDFKDFIKRERDSLREEGLDQDNKYYSSKKKSGGDLKKKMIRQGIDFSRVTEVSGKNIFVCKKCDFKASNLTTVRVHIEYDHRGGASFSCNFCVYESKKKETMKIHVKNMHPSQLQPRDEDVKMSFSCDECDYISKRERDVKSHTKLAHSKILKIVSI